MSDEFLALVCRAASFEARLLSQQPQMPPVSALSARLQAELAVSEPPRTQPRHRWQGAEARSTSRSGSQQRTAFGLQRRERQSEVDTEAQRRAVSAAQKEQHKLLQATLEYRRRQLLANRQYGELSRQRARQCLRNQSAPSRPPWRDDDDTERLSVWHTAPADPDSRLRSDEADRLPPSKYLPMREYQVETKAVMEAATQEIGTMTEGEVDPPAVLDVAIQHSPVKGVDAATLTDHQGPPSGDASPFEAEESTAEQVLRRMRLQRLERGSLPDSNTAHDFVC